MMLKRLPAACAAFLRVLRGHYRVVRPCAFCGAGRRVFRMSPEPAALAEFGIEPAEFLEALELIVERGAVSHDALYSRFGSKAGATNLLSVLEIKGLIEKPEGSSRWIIHRWKLQQTLEMVRSSLQKKAEQEHGQEDQP